VVGSVNVSASQKQKAAPVTNASEPTLVLATSADYKPYEFHDLSGGQDKIVGFDIDVANAIAKQLHFKFTIQDMDFDSLIGALQSHRADFVIAGMTPTPAREKSVDFSNLYYQATNVILTKKGIKVSSLAQLKGKTVAAQLGSIQEQLADKIKGAKVDKQTAIPTVVQEVLTGRAYAAVIEDTVAAGYAKTDNMQINRIPGLKSNGSAIAFPKGSKWTAKFNKAIATLKKDGVLQKLAEKWFGPSK
ncbi:MAG: transporter substrate-binding domain-containing protein, partial [Alicyclobacillus sp.]|nr:transporter substrate-binding domain-containing protein [Alicyclobacillus sp.]